MHRSRRLAAVIAVFVGVGLTLIPSAGANHDFFNVYGSIQFCHGWPGETQLHFKRDRVETVGSGVVSSIEFHWLLPFGVETSAAASRYIGDDAFHQTPVFAGNAWGDIKMSSGQTIAIGSVSINDSAQCF